MVKPKESLMSCNDIYYSCIRKYKKINYHFCYNQFINCKIPVKKQKILKYKLNKKN